jgi:hypothetical protein
MEGVLQHRGVGFLSEEQDAVPYVRDTIAADENGDYPAGTIAQSEILSLENDRSAVGR